MSEYFYEPKEEMFVANPSPASPAVDTLAQERAKSFVYLPPRAISMAMDDFRERATEKSVLDWGISQIDDRVIPLRRTSYTAILGRPGMGKTYEMLRLASHHSQQLRKANPQKPPLVLYATWETSVEEFIGVYSSKYTGITLSDIGRGRADLKELQKGMVTVMKDNFAVFGVSHVASRQRGKVPSLPTVQDLYWGVEYLESMGHRVGVIYVDYAQAIPNERGNMDMRDVTARVSENIVDIKSVFCVASGIPGVVGVQARREVDEYRGLKLPRIVDGQHTSVIEQAFDNVFSVTMPSKYMPTGEQFVIQDRAKTNWAYEVTPYTRVVAMLKQRYEASDQSDVWPIDFNPMTLEAKFQQTVGEYIAEDDNGLGEVI